MSLDKTTLHTIDLAPDLLLQGLESRAMLAYSVIHTLGGKAYVQSDGVDLEVGQPVTLQGENQFTLAQLQAVQQLAGQEVTLIHHRGTFRVLVTAVPEEPTHGYADPEAEDWYSGAIEMILLEIVN